MKTRSRFRARSRYDEDDDSLQAGATPPGMPIYATWTAVVAFDNVTIEEGFGVPREFHEFTWRPGVHALKSDHVPGNTETTIGQVEQFTKIEGVVYASGVFYDTHVGRTAANMAVSGALNGVSVEPGGGEATIVEDDDGFPTRFIFERYEISALAQVDIPGFEGAGFLSIELADRGDLAEPMHALAAGATVDGDLGEHDTLEDLSAEEEWGFALLTSSASFMDEYPMVSFGLPESPVPMPLTVFDDLSFAGHLAVYDTCHVAFADKCVKPPKSKLGYTPALQGNVLLDNGAKLRVARISIGSNHAPAGLNPRATNDFYEKESLCAGFADVMDGDIGIWVRGHVNLQASKELIARFASAAWSGDWRGIRRNLELIGILSVNIPGFPIPDARMWQEANETKSLVASGAKTIAALDRRRPLDWARTVHGRRPFISDEERTKLRLMDQTAKQLGLPTLAEHHDQALAAAASRVEALL